MSDRKLYEVKVEYVYYAYTETPDAAADFAEEALGDSFAPSSHAWPTEVKYKNWRINDEWDEKSLVYHDERGRDIELGEVLETLPERTK